MIRLLPWLLTIAVTVYAVVDCIQTDDAQVRGLPKLLWLLLILLFPIVGSIAWFIAGRPAARHRRPWTDRAWSISPTTTPAWPRRRPGLPP